MARRMPVPTGVISGHPLPAIDYEDAFTTPTVTAERPKASLRAVLGRAPRGLLPFVYGAQRLLGLTLVSPSEAHPLGWRVLRSDAEMCVLGTDGPHIRSRLVLRQTAGRAMVITQLQFLGGRSRAMWLLVAPAHRQIAKRLLDTIGDVSSRPQRTSRR